MTGGFIYPESAAFAHRLNRALKLELPAGTSLYWVDPIVDGKLDEPHEHCNYDLAFNHKGDGSEIVLQKPCNRYVCGPCSIPKAAVELGFLTKYCFSLDLCPLGSVYYFRSLVSTEEGRDKLIRALRQRLWDHNKINNPDPDPESYRDGYRWVWRADGSLHVFSGVDLAVKTESWIQVTYGQAKDLALAAFRLPGVDSVNGSDYWRPDKTPVKNKKSKKSTYRRAPGIRRSDRDQGWHNAWVRFGIEDYPDRHSSWHELCPPGQTVNDVLDVYHEETNKVIEERQRSREVPI